MFGKTINVPASQAGDMEHAMSPLWDWVKLTQRNVPAAGWETLLKQSQRPFPMVGRHCLK